MEVIIKKSKKSDKKNLMQLLMVRSRYHLVKKAHLIIPFIKTMTAKIDTLIAIRRTKLGDYQVLKQLDFMLSIFCGIRKVLKRLWMIRIKDISILILF